MCEYYGRHGCKRFFRGKPIRFGFKIWCGTTTYAIWFGLIHIKEKKPYHQWRKVVSAFEEILFLPLRVFSRVKNKRIFICFDNFFTSVKLMSALKRNSIKATATICKCRTEKCPLVASNDMKKLPRGSLDYKTDPENGVIVCKWNDNSVVSLCSNAVGLQPISSASRFSSVARKRVRIQQPFLVKVYKELVGRVKRMDQNVTIYQVAIRGKKWYWCLIL